MRLKIRCGGLHGDAKSMVLKWTVLLLSLLSYQWTEAITARPIELCTRYYYADRYLPGRSVWADNKKWFSFFALFEGNEFMCCEVFRVRLISQPKILLTFSRRSSIFRQRLIVVPLETISFSSIYTHDGVKTIRKSLFFFSLLILRFSKIKWQRNTHVPKWNTMAKMASLTPTTVAPDKLLIINNFAIWQ